jgi:hypothetical protein
MRTRSGREKAVRVASAHRELAKCDNVVGDQLDGNHIMEPILACRKPKDELGTLNMWKWNVRRLLWKTLGGMEVQDVRAI